MSSEREAAPRPLTGGAVIGVAGRIVVAVTGALTSVLIARLLGPEGTGGYTIALSMVLMLTLLGTLGAEHGVAYYVSGRLWSARAALMATQTLAVFTGSVTAALGIAAYLCFPDAFAGLTATEALIVAAALPFSLSWYYASYVALSVDAYEAYVAPPAVQSASLILLVGGGTVVGGLKGALVGLTASHVLTAAITLLWARRWLPAVESGPSGGSDQLRRAIAFGIKGYAANALQLVNYRLDLFVLSNFASAAVLGQYSVAIAATSIVWLLPPALSDVLFPRVAALTAQGAGDAEVHRRFVEAKSLRHTALVVAVSTAVMAIAVAALLPLVYGSDFRPAIELSFILLPGVALIGVSGVMTATIVGRGRPIYSLYTTLLVTPPTALLYILLVPSMKAHGAAIASSLSYTLSFVLALVFYHRTTGRSAIPLLVPTRSEIADYLALPSAVVGRLRGSRRGSDSTTGASRG